jgi:methionyl-tRNA formyltransferase
MKHYVIASCKEWHRPAFEKVAAKESGRWHYVATVQELERTIADAKPRYIFFLHWNWFVPATITDQFECICFHMTDVPYGRGGSPLQNLIEAGNTETKVSALRMSDEMDAGPVYDKRPMELAGRAEEIYLQAGKLCWEMIRRIIADEPRAHPQSGEATIFKRRRPEQSVLPTGGSLQKIYDHIRMLDAPTYPLAYVKHGEFHLALSHARIVGNEIHASVVIRQDNKTGYTNG